MDVPTTNVMSSLALLSGVAAVAVGALAAYVGRLRSAKTSVRIQMGGVEISITGDLTSQQANNIVKVISESNVLSNSNDGKQIGTHPPPPPTAALAKGAVEQ